MEVCTYTIKWRCQRAAFTVINGYLIEVEHIQTKDYEEE